MKNVIFSIVTPVFSLTWSSEIILIYWFAAQQTLIIIIVNVENKHNIFGGKCDPFFSILRWKEFKTTFILNRNLFYHYECFYCPFLS